MTDERANEISYAVGNALGRIMRAAIIIAGCAGLMSTCTGLGAKQIEEKAKTEIVKKKSPKRAKKKCLCECKKIVDNTRQVDYTNFIGPRD